jgi:hypothetical protein
MTDMGKPRNLVGQHVEHAAVALQPLEDGSGIVVDRQRRCRGAPSETIDGISAPSTPPPSPARRPERIELAFVSTRSTAPSVLETSTM